MVHDDDMRPIPPWGISPDDEPLVTKPPTDRRTSDMILEIARDNPRWGRLRICDELTRRGIDVEEAVVNHVLKQHNLPNLRR